VQGTVCEFAAAAGAGRVLFDDGRDVSFGPATFVASGLRRFRIGQRVRLETADSDRQRPGQRPGQRDHPGDSHDPDSMSTGGRRESWA